MQSEKPLIFVSCGQSTEAEKRLGHAICALIRELRPDLAAYFAEDQSTVEGLSNNILKALSNAAGFICVMHRRGDIGTPDKRTVVRGSVWIEQEIAITAFMGHVLGRTIPTLFYKQAGISREGIRSVLLMNPLVEFVEDSQVLEHLKLTLPSVVVNPFYEYDIEPVISYKCMSRNDGGRHTYLLTANVKNVGKQRITDFLMYVYFPREFLNSRTTWVAEDTRLSTPTHICFAADQKLAPAGLYPGQAMKAPLSFEYFMDSHLFFDSTAMQSKIFVELYSGSICKKLELNIRDWQQF